MGNSGNHFMKVHPYCGQRVHAKELLSASLSFSYVPSSRGASKACGESHDICDSLVCICLLCCEARDETASQTRHSEAAESGIAHVARPNASQRRTSQQRHGWQLV